MEASIIVKNDKFPKIEAEFVKKENNICMMGFKVKSSGYKPSELLESIDEVMNYVENEYGSRKKSN